MAQDSTNFYPYAAGLPSGATMGGFSGMVSMGIPPSAATPSTGFTAGGGLATGILPFVFWTAAFLGSGLFLLHWSR